MPKRPRDPNQLAKHIVGIATGEIEDRELTPQFDGQCLSLPDLLISRLTCKAFY